MHFTTTSIFPLSFHSWICIISNQIVCWTALHLMGTNTTLYFESLCLKVPAYRQKFWQTLCSNWSTASLPLAWVWHNYRECPQKPSRQSSWDFRHLTLSTDRINLISSPFFSLHPWSTLHKVNEKSYLKIGHCDLTRALIAKKPSFIFTTLD